MQRNLNYVFEIKFNFVGGQRIRESVERLLQLRFEIFQSPQNCVDRYLIQYSTGSVYEQTNVFVKFDV
jgi:hypothetical protein